MQKNLTTIKTILLVFLLVLLVCSLTVTLAFTYQQNVAQAEETTVVAAETSMPIANIKTVGNLESLSEAMSNLADGDVIKLTDNIVLAGMLKWLPFNKAGTYTLDLNGKTLTGDATLRVITIDNASATLNIIDSSGNNSGTVTNGNGAIAVYNGTLNISGGTFSGNYTTGGGGCVYISGDNSSFTMNGGIISNNISNGSGGGVTVTNGAKFTMNDSAEISGNTTASNGSGGGVFVYNGAFTMNGGTISENKAEGGGGVIVWDDGSFVMNGGIITGNTTTNSGAGVSIAKGSFKMGGTAEIKYNQSIFGGGVIIWDGTFVMEDGRIYNNNAYYGGGVYIVSNDSEFTMSGGTISGNTAAYDGGGVCVYLDCTFTIKDNAVIAGNIANTNGGGIIVNGTGSRFKMEGGEVKMNTVYGTGSGGGIFVSDGGTFTMSGGAISNNTTGANGGGVVVLNKCSFLMNNGRITGNTAASQGGAVYVQNGGTYTMTGGNVTGNLANYSGGGIQLEPTAIFNLSGSPVINNNSVNGVANNLYVHSNIVNVTGEFDIGAKIGITNYSIDSALVFTSSNGYISSTSTQYFHADNETQCIGYKSGSLVLNPHNPELQHSADSHSYKCANCKVVSGSVTHNWSELPYVADDNGTTHHRECPVCNETKSSVAHIVTIATKTDDSNHTGYCDDCKVQVRVSHTITDNFNDDGNHVLNGHWQTCSICNGKVNEATHEWGGDWKDAGDYHLQTCEICTQEYRQDHTFSSWTTAGETDHTRKCEDCQREETSNHVAGDAFYNDGTGNHYKKCQDCDAEMERQSHNYNGKYYDDGKGNHYQICEDCNYTTEYTPHTVTSWSSKGSETHQGQCETCQLTVVASHDWADTKTFDDYGHWYKCNVQDCDAKNEYHEHVVSTWINFKDEANHKGNCTDCDKQDITAPHILGKLQQDEEGYYQECTVCKYKVEYSDVGENHEHDYSELCYDKVSHWYKCECGALQNVKPHDNSEWKFEGKNHYKYCETCKQKYLDDEHSLIKHTGYEETCNATGLKDYWECRICNSYFTDEGVTRITMDINTWLEREEQSGGGIIPSNSAKHQYDQVNFKSNETGHWYECTVCGEKLGSIANHVDVDDWTDNGDGRHYKTCQYCNYVTKYEAHNGANWRTDGNQTHTGTCLDCGATVTQSHDWNNTFTYDEYTHWYACKATGCTERKAETAHVGNNWQNVGNSTYHEGLCDCGYAHVKQNHTLTWETYQDSYRQECKICGYADDSSVTDHVFTYWEYLNEEEHRSHCDIPNHEDVQTAVHVWETKYDQTSHWQVCKDCGYEKDNSRTTHVLTSGTQNHDETHTGVCEICGLTVSVSHLWSEDYVTDDNGHWYECTVCHDRKNYEQHQLEFTTDGEHTHSGSCTVCGKHFEKEHTWLFGFCTECPDQLKNYSEADIGIAATAIVAQLFALIAVAAIISRRIKR